MGRISPQEAIELFNQPLSEIKALAHERRCQILPQNEATYLIMRIVSLTNVCVADCSYCAFYRKPGDPEGYVLTQGQIFEKVDELLAKGGKLVAMEGGFNPDLRIEHYEKLFSAMRKRYGEKIEIYGLTSVEILYVAKRSRLSLEEALKRLHASGLRWIPGGGAEVLTPGWRKLLSPKKYSVEQYFEIMEAGLKAGFGITSTMVIGFGEDAIARVEHLKRVRDFQDRTGGFKSFLCWTYQPANTALGGTVISNEEYLKTIAVARLFLDNIPHIRASILTQGEGAVAALHGGADDFDIPLEDQVTQQAGAKIEPNISKVLGWVEKTGLKPVAREPWPVK
ncbi:MAG: radical SAM protein [bacterium]|nr:radical SAM protein [bacterium]